jgi:hypothetical protein
MTCSSANQVPASLAVLLATATHEMDQHVNQNGLCAVCGSAWPRTRVQLADVVPAAL